MGHFDGTLEKTYILLVEKKGGGQKTRKLLFKCQPYLKDADTTEEKTTVLRKKLWTYCCRLTDWLYRKLERQSYMSLYILYVLALYKDTRFKDRSFLNKFMLFKVLWFCFCFSHRPGLELPGKLSLIVVLLFWCLRWKTLKDFIFFLVHSTISFHLVCLLQK